MANISKTQLNNRLRQSFIDRVTKMLQTDGDEVLVTASNEICVPCVDEMGNDEYMVIKFSIPKGSRDGETYDGYAIADEYKMKLAEKEETAKKNAKAKADKIAHDKADREAKAKAKAEHNAKKGE